MILCIYVLTFVTLFSVSWYFAEREYNKGNVIYLHNWVPGNFIICFLLREEDLIRFHTVNIKKGEPFCTFMVLHLTNLYWTMIPFKHETMYFMEFYKIIYLWNSWLCLWIIVFTKVHSSHRWYLVGIPKLISLCDL